MSKIWPPGANTPEWREKLANAEMRGSQWLALANEHSEAGRHKQAEKCYAKSQFWLDRINKLLGNY